MKKRTLNLHVAEPEHAWLKVFADREGLSLTMAVRTLIREHMRRELVAEAIACGLRCAWEGCTNLPAKDGGDRPDLCSAHQDAAEAKLQERRKEKRRA